MTRARQFGRKVPVALVSLMVAGMLTVVAFPEVVFAHGSVTGAGMIPVVDEAHRAHTTSVWPTVGTRPVGSGSSDLGARASQFEPTITYMHEVLTHRQDPSWNPWQASGQLGPETLDGMEFSPFVLSAAALGGTQQAFNLVALAFVLVALYCLQQFFVRTLRLGRTAAVGACVMFLLNGWMTQNFASVTCIPYLMFPMLLYAVTEYQRDRKPWRFVVASGVYAAVWLTTFPAGQFSDIVVVTAVALCLDLARARGGDPTRSTASRWSRAVGRQAVLPVIGLLGAAFVLVPAVVAFLHAGSDIQTYSQSHLVTHAPVQWLSLLTPRNVYTSYIPSSFPANVPVGMDLTLYLGIAPLMLTAAAWPRARGVSRTLLTVLLALTAIAVAQVMGAPGLSLLGDLPGLRIMSQDYWGALAASCLTLAFGVAVETARRRGLSLRVALGAAGLIFAALIAAAATVAARVASDHASVAIHLVVAAATAALVVLLVWWGSRVGTRRLVFAGPAVGLVAVELFSYQNHLRPRRRDVTAPTPPYVQYLYEHLGNQRTLNSGRLALTPDWGSALGIRQVESTDVMQIPWYRTFFQTYIDPESHGARFLHTGEKRARTFSASPSALDLLSVKYLVIDQRAISFVKSVVASGYPRVYYDKSSHVLIYLNPDAFPRAFLSPALTTGQRMPTNPPWRRSTTVTQDRPLLAEAARAHIPTHGSDAADPGTATITTDESTEVQIHVHATKPSVLVLADTYHPNWTATVNGHPARVGRVDSVVRGVVVPAGTSTVTFEYHSKPRDVGELISAATVAVVVAIAGGWAWRRRRRRSPSAADLR